MAALRELHCEIRQMLPAGNHIRIKSLIEQQYPHVTKKADEN